MDVLCRTVCASRSFGAVKAVAEFDSEFDRGEIVGIIGPNGSGKTTLLNCISGHLHFSSGQVFWKDTEVTRWSMDRLARSGLVRTFQQSMFFGSRTVADNVALAIDVVRASGRGKRTHSVPSAAQLLERAGLAEVAGKPSGSLSHGAIRLVGLAMAMALSPQMLLLDEPAAGLNESEAAQLAQIILGLQDEGVTTVVIDHDMGFITSVAQRLIVMAAGQKLTEGRPDDVLRDRRVIDVYLGPGHPAGAGQGEG